MDICTFSIIKLKYKRQNLKIKLSGETESNTVKIGNIKMSLSRMKTLQTEN